MKKILLLGLLICSLNMSAQQFIKEYAMGLMTKDGVKGEWVNTDVTAYYNYGNDLRKMKFEVNGETFTMTQVGGTTIETTTNGLKYQRLQMTDDATGETLIINLYEEAKYGVMLVFDNFNTLQFAP